MNAVRNPTGTGLAVSLLLLLVPFLWPLTMYMWLRYFTGHRGGAAAEGAASDTVAGVAHVGEVGPGAPQPAVATRSHRRASGLTTRRVAVIASIVMGLLVGINAFAVTSVPAVESVVRYSCSDTPPDAGIIRYQFMASTSSATFEEALGKWNALDEQTRNGWRQLATNHNAACPPTAATAARTDVTVNAAYVPAGIAAAVATFLIIAAVSAAWRSMQVPKGA
jgi:hypothetical protein